MYLQQTGFKMAEFRDRFQFNGVPGLKAVKNIFDKWQILMNK